MKSPCFGWSSALAILLLPSAALAEISLHDVAGTSPHEAGAVIQQLISVGGKKAMLQPSGKALASSEVPLVEQFVQPGISWQPPRHLLLDSARGSSGAEWGVGPVVERNLETGAGVAIGVLDSGLDLYHPDLRKADGSTRVLWWLDFGLEPLGLYPELEASMGCEQGGPVRCAVLGEAELNQLLQNDALAESGQELPLDVLGHGTHVSSIAAGNGAVDSRYRGVAPEASLIVARIAGSDALVFDTDIIAATRFVFERAEALGMPAVVNLSLGSDFGPHDGSSILSRSLSLLIRDKPGRAVVVASGNSATLAEPVEGYPGPLGIHTQVHVTPGAESRIPLLTPPTVSGDVGVYIWIEAQAGSSLQMSLDDANARRVVGPVEPGALAFAQKDGWETSLINATTSEEFGSEQAGSALILSGAVPPAQVFALVFEGSGTVDVWVQSEGGWAPERSSGVLLPAAQREATVAIPAEAPELIAVGATLNRLDWEGMRGERVSLIDAIPGLRLVPGVVASFSSQGPVSGGRLKPDLVAPGVAVVAALSDAARPVSDGRPNRSSLFFASPLCFEIGSADIACAQSGTHYAASAGTSMAAPFVAGAVALLFERDPSLTQTQIQRLLWSTAASHPEAGPAAGAGVVDVSRSLQALTRASGADSDPDPQLGEDATPDWGELVPADWTMQPGQLLSVLLRVRDASGRPVPEQELKEVGVTLSRGRIVERQVNVAGLIELSVEAPADAGGSSFSVEAWTGSRKLARVDLRVEVDRHVGTGFMLPFSGCSQVRAFGSRPQWLLILLPLVVSLGRRWCGGVPTVRDPGRRDG